MKLEEALPIEPVAEKPKLSDNLVLRVGVSQPIDDSARCYRCGSTVERLNARMVGQKQDNLGLQILQCQRHSTA